MRQDASEDLHVELQTLERIQVGHALAQKRTLRHLARLYSFCRHVDLHPLPLRQLCQVDGLAQMPSVLLAEFLQTNNGCALSEQNISSRNRTGIRPTCSCELFKSRIARCS